MLPLDQATVERFAILRGQRSRPVRRQVGDMDPLIAATALRHDLARVTRNLRDVRLVPGRRFYDEG